jgi:flagellar biosynthesis protein FliR
MPTDLRLPWDGLLGFGLVFARVAGAISFVPLPVFKNAPTTARIVLALGLTGALLPVWPAISPQVMEAGLIARWMISEVAFGVTVGVAISFLNEAFVLSSQIFGLQAGYGYASTVDPATQADSSVLQIVSHLAGGLLFFATGLHHEVIRIFADSLIVHPPGQYRITPIGAEQILSLGTIMFQVAVRMALPVVGLLMLIDLSLALLGRINAQLQLLTLAFPIKMIVSMGLLTVIAALMPTLYETGATAVFGTLRRVLIGG